MLYKALKLKMMTLLRVLALMVPLCFIQNIASASWLTETLSGLKPPCVPAPDYTEYDVSNQTINLATNLGVWQSAGKTVSSGDSVKFAWNTQNIYVPPRKYYVLYRIDPRFERPQLFIKQYNYATGKWDSDFDNFVGRCGKGSLTYYQSKTPPVPAQNNTNIIPSQLCADGVTTYTINDQITDFVNYFNFVGRPTINVNSGDIINIRWESLPSTFFSIGSTTTNDWSINSFGATPPVHYIYTSIGNETNGLIYATMSDFYNFVKVKTNTFTSTAATNSPNNLFLSPLSNKMMPFTVGIIDTSLLITNASPMTICANGVEAFGSPLCENNYLRGVRITIGDNIIKPTISPFNYSGLTGYSIFYNQAQNSGVLDFNSDWSINSPVQIGASTNVPMFTTSDGLSSINYNYMKNWSYSPGGWTYQDLYNQLSAMKNAYASYVHAGRYLMTVEIGGNEVGLQEDLGMEYTIAPTIPSNTISGTQVAANNTIYADRDGPLWIRMVSSDNSYNFQGTVQVSMATYSGSTMISDFVYNDIIDPICSSLNKLTYTLYNGLVNNKTLKNIAASLLTLYIMLYGIYYLAGATQIKTSDLVARIVKITIIGILFSPDSWEFFNNHLFKAFANGTNYLIMNIIGTNTHNNMFGFLDTVFNKYTNLNLWANLLIELCQLPNGLIFFASLVIIGLIKYLLAMLEVVISYLMAFVSVSVMIALAPFFITFMLFERTKNLFNNWISALFNAAILPTILMIFYLLIDDIMTLLLENAVVKSCWDTWLPMAFYLDLKPIGINWDISFHIPGFPGLPFWVPVADVGGIMGQPGSHFTIMTSSVLFFCYAQMASKLVDYVTSIVGSLTSIGIVDGGVAGQQGANAILGDVNAIKDWALAKAAGGAIAAYNGARDPNSRLNRLSSSVARGGSAVASSIYHAPKNAAKGAAYIYENLATKDGREGLKDSVKLMGEKLASKSYRKQQLAKAGSSIKNFVAHAPTKAINATGEAARGALNNYVAKQIQKGIEMNQKFDHDREMMNPLNFIRNVTEDLTSSGQKVEAKMQRIQKDAVNLAERTKSAVYHAPKNIAEAVGEVVGKTVAVGEAVSSAAGAGLNKVKAVKKWTQSGNVVKDVKKVGGDNRRSAVQRGRDVSGKVFDAAASSAKEGVHQILDGVKSAGSAIYNAPGAVADATVGAASRKVVRGAKAVAAVSGEIKDATVKEYKHKKEVFGNAVAKGREQAKTEREEARIRRQKEREELAKGNAQEAIDGPARMEARKKLAKDVVNNAAQGVKDFAHDGLEVGRVAKKSVAARTHEVLEGARAGVKLLDKKIESISDGLGLTKKGRDARKLKKDEKAARDLRKKLEDRHLKAKAKAKAAEEKINLKEQKAKEKASANLARKESREKFKQDALQRVKGLTHEGLEIVRVGKKIVADRTHEGLEGARVAGKVIKEAPKKTQNVLDESMKSLRKNLDEKSKKFELGKEYVASGKAKDDALKVIKDASDKTYDATIGSARRGADRARQEFNASLKKGAKNIRDSFDREKEAVNNALSKAVGKEARARSAAKIADAYSEGKAKGMGADMSEQAVAQRQAKRDQKRINREAAKTKHNKSTTIQNPMNQKPTNEN